MRALRVARAGLLAVSTVLLGYLVVLALRPPTRLPEPLDWFGTPADWRTIAIVVSAVGLLCVVSFQARRNRASATVPVVIVVGLFFVAFVLGFSSYWSCNGSAHPTFFTPLEWTASLVKGGIDEKSVRAGVCPESPPVAVDVARLAILAAFALGIVGVVTSAFRLQSDRIRISAARSVTVVVDVDEDSESMVNAIAQTSAYTGTLALLTTNTESQVAQNCRTKGARIIPVDFSRPETVGTKRLWRRLNKIYLLAPDASTNLSRLRVINRRLAEVGTKRRIPLIVRIDDPWQAKAWRAQQFGGSDNRWAADSVGKYEVTARRLLDQIIKPGNVANIVICGSSQLTLALCADMARRQTERDYYEADDVPELPVLTLVDINAAEYRRDHEFHESQRGFGTSHVTVDIVEDPPTEMLLSGLIGRSDAGTDGTAVVFVDAPLEPTTATRLAARFTALPIYTWHAKATVAAEAVPVVGQLRNYRLGIDLPTGQAHDNWERAAMLIHERYAASTSRSTPAQVPWDRLDEFYRESNRRQVHNALWMAEHLAGHTWNTWGSPPDGGSPATLTAMEPIEQLRSLGFTDDAAHAMARAEFEDWSRYLRRAGWQHGLEPDPANKVHDKLITWEETAASDEKLGAALRSLATTMIELRELGYRSRQLWDPYRRVGSVNAKRRWVQWSWEGSSGDVMRGGPGDWDVGDATGNRWSVRNDVFRTSYRQVGEDRWDATGIVLARKAEPGETIDTLEGPERAALGDWIIQGDVGEQWPVSAQKFATRYQGPVSFAERYEHWQGRFQGR